MEFKPQIVSLIKSRGLISNWYWRMFMILPSDGPSQESRLCPGQNSTVLTWQALLPPCPSLFSPITSLLDDILHLISIESILCTMTRMFFLKHKLAHIPSQFKFLTRAFRMKFQTSWLNIYNHFVKEPFPTFSINLLPLVLKALFARAMWKCCSNSDTHYY